jgi:hypothetical protein
MKLPTWPEFYQSTRRFFVDALGDFGFTEPQARFMVHVLTSSGVFLERQYSRFTGVPHGRKTYEFLRVLIDRKYATVFTPGKLHSGRLYHVHHKPLYEALREPDNRNRRPAALGRLVERLMLLDIVLGDKDHYWLGTEKDKVGYFRDHERYGEKLKDDVLPRFVYRAGESKTIRYFPDKLPIGIGRESRRYLFVYLARHERPDEFRLFLGRHAELLRHLTEWTIRIVFPRRFVKARQLYQWAVREELATPLDHRLVDELDWYFRSKHGRDLSNVAAPDLTMAEAARKFRAARYQALERRWLQDRGSLWDISSHTLKEHWQMGRGRVEMVVLPHQYLQLTSLVGVA